jgi:hypothetical protein
VPEAGKLLVVVGGVVVLVGLLLMVGGRVPFLGRLPGDISFSRGNTHVYIPLASGILISILLTVVLNLFFRNR